MNIPRILALADIIEMQPHTDYEAPSGFTMEATIHTCGTPACIGGWAEWEAQGRPEKVQCFIDWSRAANYLEIGDNQAFTLFTPEGYEDNTITPSHAAAVLRHLAETGEVDWEVGR